MEEVGKGGKLKLNGSQHKNSIVYPPADMVESFTFMRTLVAEMKTCQKVISRKTIHQMRAEVW